MRNKLIQYTVVILLIVLIGGHWFLLQSVAWVAMFNRFSQNNSLATALIKTFDGKHPCQLCKIIEENRKSDRKKDAVKVGIKIDCFLLKDQSAPNRPDTRLSNRFVVFSELALTRYERPPTPPPRCV